MSVLVMILQAHARLTWPDSDLVAGQNAVSIAANRCLDTHRAVYYPHVGCDRSDPAQFTSVLSYFRSYFDPGGQARFRNHSTGQIAAHLHELLSERGPVTYFGSKERPSGLEADLF